MLFNSLNFILFILPVFFIYWFIVNRRLDVQNLFLLVASYVFYGFWDWRFLILIFVSTLCDFLIGRQLGLGAGKLKRVVLLVLSLILNLGLLMTFKYLNFFIESFNALSNTVGLGFNGDYINVILPVGISFYTFQTLSYTIDVYRGKLEPTKSFVSFAAFVSFFPQLVAGPIERASNLLPQFHRERNFDAEKAKDGLRQILWGLFKKVVIADNCAIYVNLIFADYTNFSSSTLFLGGVLFAFQIYGDFSGYSDMAIGLARLFGISLKQNFAFPYFSRDIAEFWRRWHISLSTWFRDYLYIPLGGSRGSLPRTLLNIVIIFLVSGFWHGANFTFIIWGAINALFILPLIIFGINRNNLDVVAKGKLVPSAKEFLSIGVTFFITTVAWIFFRADSVAVAYHYLKSMLSTSIMVPNILDLKKISNGADIVYVVILVVLMLVVEWFQREKQHGLELEGAKQGRAVRWFSYYGIVFLIIWFGGSQQDFIYFQF